METTMGWPTAVEHIGYAFAAAGAFSAFVIAVFSALR
jgi:hypothetical protein